MGGAHNVALAQLSGDPLPSKRTYKGTNSERFNAQAAAYEHLSKVYQPKTIHKYNAMQDETRKSILSSLGEMYFGRTRGGNVSPQARMKNYCETAAFAAFMLFGGISIAYFVTFRGYHASLVKQDSLTELFKNPNARVAAGKKGKKLMKKLQKLETKDSKKEKKEKKRKQKAMSENDRALAQVKAILV